METVKYYYCTVCGNVIEKVHDSGLTPMCCMRDMQEMIGRETGDFAASHVPVMKCHKHKCTVYVGDMPHPMDKNHYIEWIEIVTNMGIHRHCLKPGDLPMTTFRLDDEEKVLEVYAYCNMHKLWKCKPECDSGTEYDRYVDD